MSSHDAILLVSFGGPEGPDDVMPFLENVVRGKRVPPERLAAVAEHYELFDGVSPVNAENRALLAALLNELGAHGCSLPVYWGNRNWHPMLADTMRQMADDGVRRALAFVTSAFGSFASCRQYIEDIARAREEVGDAAPRVDKLRLFYNHPGFVEAMAERVEAALAKLPDERRADARLIYTAHSLPVDMASRCDYEAQVRDACELVAQQIGRPDWQLAWQSCSGRPSQPWLEPDISDTLREMAQSCPGGDAVIAPIGFVGEHMETVHDLDVVAGEVCDEVGLNMVRSATVGCHPRFVRMIRELIEERLGDTSTRAALGDRGPAPDECPGDCCPAG